MYCLYVYVYKPLPPGVNPIAVDKYININNSKIHFPSLTTGQKHEKNLCYLLNSQKKFYSKLNCIRIYLQTEKPNSPFGYLQTFEGAIPHRVILQYKFSSWLEVKMGPH
jgi:hypothetical protein